MPVNPETCGNPGFSWFPKHSAAHFKQIVEPSPGLGIQRGLFTAATPWFNIISFKLEAHISRIMEKMKFAVKIKVVEH